MRDGRGLGVVLLISVVGRKVCRLILSAMASREGSFFASVSLTLDNNLSAPSSFCPCIQTVVDYGSL